MDLTGDLRGSTLHDADLRDSTFRSVNLNGSRFRDLGLKHADIRDAELYDVHIDAEIRDVVINGVDIGPLVEAELDRRDPDRPLMRPADADGFRRAWSIVEQRWEETVARARRLPTAALDESVDGEWSFLQTLRHLVYATDVWLRRMIHGDPNPFDRLGLPFTGAPSHPDLRIDADARPALAEVLALRAERMGGVRDLMAGLDDAALDVTTEPVDGPGWPPARSLPVRECLSVILNEEYLHRQYAERDLAVLESR